MTTKRNALILVTCPELNEVIASEEFPMLQMYIGGVMRNSKGDFICEAALTKNENNKWIFADKDLLHSTGLGDCLFDYCFNEAQDECKKFFEKYPKGFTFTRIKVIGDYE